MELGVPVTHTAIHCKLKTYKTKVYLTYRLIKVRIENSYIGVQEAVSNSGSMADATFLTVNFFFLIFRIVFCTDKTGKRAKVFSRQNSGFAVRGQP